MSRSPRARYLIPAFSLIAVTGCSGGGAQLPSLTAPTLPTLTATSPSASEAPPPPGESPPASIDVSATELYTRVARGAMSCWFSGAAPLKKDYIYHADADAPSRGGKALIVVHVRDATQSNPRGVKAYRITIDPAGAAAATIKTENMKMPEAVAAGMTSDVDRWSRGEQGCAGTSAVAGWGTSANSGETAAAAPAKPQQAKKKSQAKAKAKTTAAP